MPARFAPYGKAAQTIRKNDKNRPKVGIVRTHPPFKFSWRPTPKFLFVYPKSNATMRSMTVPHFSYIGASTALGPIHKKRKAVLTRKLRRKPKKMVTRAKRVRFSRKTKRV